MQTIKTNIDCVILQICSIKCQSICLKIIILEDFVDKGKNNLEGDNLIGKDSVYLL